MVCNLQFIFLDSQLTSAMGPVRIRHCSYDFATQCSHSVDLAGWQAKMVSIEFGYHVVIRTSPIDTSGKTFQILFVLVSWQLKTKMFRIIKQVV